jgi:CTP synthase (UTP-ammonia lyase)
MAPRIAIVGDYQPTNETHLACSTSLDHAGGSGGVSSEWIATEAIADAAATLQWFDGVLIAPGSPYESIEGALAAITYCRESGTPLLGTCAGFQHMIIEFARSVLGITDAHHAEYDPYASTLFVTPLSCSLVGETMTVEIRSDSTARRLYGEDGTKERYYCNFGLNPECEPALVASGLVVSGRDDEGEARIVELPGHPFFLGTLFVPQTSSTPSKPHPLISGFVETAAIRSRSEGRLKN